MRIKNWFLKPLSSEELDELARQTPVILMGRGHSGTRVLSWTCSRLGLHLGTSDGLATGDADDQVFTDEIKALATRNVGITDVDQVRPEDLAAFQRAVLSYLKRVGQPGTLWGWKFPETYLIAPIVLSCFPKAKFIHLIRDGRDIAFKNHLTDDPKRKLGRILLKKAGAFDLPHHLQAAISWDYQLRGFDQFRRRLESSQVFNIRFEDLCGRPFDVVPKLAEFLGLSFTEACQEYLRESLNPSKIGQYRENDPELIRQVEERIAENLTKYGYLNDNILHSAQPNP